MKELIKFRFLIFLFLSASSFGQVANLLLNQTLLPGDYIARDLITASPGCKAQPIGINQIHLFIDPSIQLPHSYQSNTVSNTGVLPINRTLDYSLPVGSTQGTYKVSEKGTLLYNIPIIIPDGTMGMKPKLSLGYESTKSSGILGFGWRLNGLSVISRQSQSLYHNNNISPIQLSNDDWFALDGNKLIPFNGLNGQDNSDYSTEIETFSKITSRGTNGNGPEWFKVETKEGITMEYGNSTDSRVYPVGKNTIYEWRINKMYDNFGNYILFEYKTTNSEVNIKRISYTGNSSPGGFPGNSAQRDHLFSEQTDHLKLTA